MRLVVRHAATRSALFFGANSKLPLNSSALSASAEGHIPEIKLKDVLRLPGLIHGENARDAASVFQRRASSYTPGTTRSYAPALRGGGRVAALQRE